MGNQKWALWESLLHCASSLWVCLLPFKTRTPGAVCIDKTHEYLSRSYLSFDPTHSPLLTPKQYSLCFSFCVSTRRSALHSYLPSMSTMSLHLLCVAGIIPSHSLHHPLTSTSALFHLVFSLCNRKVKDTLPLFRQFFSSAFSLTYVSLASMKLPPDVLRCLSALILYPNLHPFIQTPLQWIDVLSFPSLSFLCHYPSCLHRALLTGLTSNPHINDLHLDISGCEVRVHLYICSAFEIKGIVQCFLLIQSGGHAV